MAPAVTKTKRKSSDKKFKSSDDTSDRPAKKAKTSSVAAEVAEKLPAAQARKNRKRAADFIENDSEEEVEALVKVSAKSKKVKAAPETTDVVRSHTSSTKKSISKKDKDDGPTQVKSIGSMPVATEKEEVPATISKPKPSKKKSGKAAVQSTTPVEDDFARFSSSDEEDANIAEQTAALLAGFDSSSDESDPKEDIPLDHVPKINISKKERKALVAAQNGRPGTIYVGRVPHGFFEHQMRAYFTQFGTVVRLRLARNKKTGASKHYAFIEFDSGEVADIVARTMNNYLMFGHILKVRRVPDEQIHPDLWKGAGKRFKVIPRAKIEARRLNTPKGREYWRMKVEQEMDKRSEKVAKLKAMGYEFELPTLRSVDDVPMNDGPAVASVDEAPKAIQETATEIEEPAEKEILKVVEQVIKASAAEDGIEFSEKIVHKETVKVKVKKSKRAAKV